MKSKEFVIWTYYVLQNRTKTKSVLNRSGQPLIIMIYYHDYVVQHYGRHLIAALGNQFE